MSSKTRPRSSLLSKLLSPLSVSLIIGLPRLFLSPTFSPIPDCDETFNYYEPLHHLLFGRGLQTWEYSPHYGLRSWVYVWIYAIAGAFVGSETWGLGERSGVRLFWVSRVYIGLMSLGAEVWFVRAWVQFSQKTMAFRRRGIGQLIGIILVLVLACSSGTFFLFGNFLPSTFSAHCLLVVLGAWMRIEAHSENRRRRVLLTHIGVFFAVLSVVVGWPFSIIALIPIIPFIIARDWFTTLKASFLWSVVIAGLMILGDSWVYRRPISTTLNLVLYNKGSGSELYGVEGPFFYLKNLLINLNVMLPFAILGILASGSLSVVKFGLCALVWVVFYSVPPHKEERFMTPVVGVICWLGAVGLARASVFVGWVFGERRGKKEKEVVGKEKQEGSSRSRRRRMRRRKKAAVGDTDEQQREQQHVCPRFGRFMRLFFLGSVLAIFVLVSFSRTISQLIYYRAPLRVYSKLSSHLTEAHDPLNTPSRAMHQINVCVGKEWYRFPSSFFLPYNHTRLAFIRSKFDGLLPQYYQEGPDARRVIPPNMNDRNEEDLSRYVDVSSCHYLVDFDFGAQSEERYFEDWRTWEFLIQDWFLDVDGSQDALCRALWIPGEMCRDKNVWGKYFVLRNRKLFSLEP